LQGQNNVSLVFEPFKVQRKGANLASAHKRLLKLWCPTKGVCNASACIPQGCRKLFPMKVILTSAFLKQLTVEQYGELLYLKDADADESFHPTPPLYFFALEVSPPPPLKYLISLTLAKKPPILIPFHQCRSRQEPLDPVMPRLSASDSAHPCWASPD
jgi:hypothetical protein